EALPPNRELEQNVRGRDGEEDGEQPMIDGDPHSMAREIELGLGPRPDPPAHRPAVGHAFERVYQEVFVQVVVTGELPHRPSAAAPGFDEVVVHPGAATL